MMQHKPRCVPPTAPEPSPELSESCPKPPRKHAPIWEERNPIAFSWREKGTKAMPHAPTRGAPAGSLDKAPGSVTYGQPAGGLLPCLCVFGPRTKLTARQKKDTKELRGPDPGPLLLGAGGEETPANSLPGVTHTDTHFESKQGEPQIVKATYLTYMIPSNCRGSNPHKSPNHPSKPPIQGSL